MKFESSAISVRDCTLFSSSAGLCAWALCMGFVHGLCAWGLFMGFVYGLGLPLQAEYFCMIDFVRPGMLGTSVQFTKDFIRPIEGGQLQTATEAQVTRMKERAHVLHTLLAPCVDRADLSVLEQYLPRKQEFVLLVRLSSLQRGLYRRFLRVHGYDTMAVEAAARRKAVEDAQAAAAAAAAGLISTEAMEGDEEAVIDVGDRATSARQEDDKGELAEVEVEVIDVEAISSAQVSDVVVGGTGRKRARSAMKKSSAKGGGKITLASMFAAKRTTAVKKVDRRTWETLDCLRLTTPLQRFGHIRVCCCWRTERPRRDR